MSALSSTASTKPALGIDAEQRVPEIAQAPSPMNDFNL